MFRYCTIVVVSLAFIIGSACYSPHEKPLRLGKILWPGYELLYLAQQQGFTDPSVVRLIQLSSATEIMRAFRQGQLDVAALTLDEVIRLTQTEDDLRVFLIMNISHGADKVVAGNAIRQPQDLAGKRLALETSGVGAMMLLEVMQAGGLTHDQLTLIPATIDQQISVMQQGEADAAITFNPTATNLVKQGFQVIFDSTPVQHKIMDVLVTREALLKERPEQFIHLLNGHWQALNLLNNQPEIVLPILAPLLDVTEQDLVEIYQELIIPDAQENANLLQQELVVLSIAIRDAMFEFGLLGEAPVMDDLADTTLLDSSR